MHRHMLLFCSSTSPDLLGSDWLVARCPVYIANLDPLIFACCFLLFHLYIPKLFTSYNVFCSHWGCCSLSFILFHQHATFASISHLLVPGKPYQGRIQDFYFVLYFFIYWGGGGAKDYVRDAQHEREARSPLRPGSRARLRALEALEIFGALSCYLSVIFGSILRKKLNKKPKTLYRSKTLFFGGGGRAGAYCAPLWIRHWTRIPI